MIFDHHIRASINLINDLFANLHEHQIEENHYKFLFCLDKRREHSFKPSIVARKTHAVRYHHLKVPLRAYQLYCTPVSEYPETVNRKKKTERNNK